MLSRPARGPARAPSLSIPVMLLRAHEPTISFYRYLYNTIGQDWLWYERRQMSDNALAEIIHDEKVLVNVLYCGGVPAGYAELDMRFFPTIEVAYLGLLPEFIGRGLGRYIVDWAVDAAWDQEPTRVWIHTCNLDHPAALRTYQKAGFSPFQQETVTIPNPRLLPTFSKPELVASGTPGQSKTDTGPDQE
ncbi:MAG: GNAT family N-acetyltransferase [Alphaproteobacteria bacterium]|nr:GNAT family N-acetyltransferase [Alphaproteobacteria bacterium]